MVIWLKLPLTSPPGALTVTAPPVTWTSIGVLEVRATGPPELIELVTGPGAATETEPPALIVLETPPELETTEAAPGVETDALTGPCAVRQPRRRP